MTHPNTPRHAQLADTPADLPDLGPVAPIPLPPPADDSLAAATAPAPSVTTAASPTQTLYLTEPGDQTAINLDDLHQGQIGDCFLISSMGELALTDPAAIANMIKPGANGTETVTLHEAANGALPTFGATAYKTVQVTVSNIFPSYAVNNAANQDVVGAQKEIWAQVLEKAVATLDGGYGAIAYGGNPMIATEELTGKAATAIAPASLNATTLAALVKAGDMLVFDTANSNALPDELVGNHAYMFEKATTANGVTSIQLANPWGTDQPAAIPLSQLSKAFVEIDIGHA